MKTEDDIVALCRQLIERGSISFSGAARLFDPETRDSAYMLYAWCRHCDDVIDDQELGLSRGGAGQPQTQAQRDASLDRLERQTRDALDGKATEPVFVALQRVVERHDIPHIHPLELIEGFRMDVDGAHHATLDDTLTYCYHVAGVVGVMMAMIMGTRDADALNRAADLGIAFQLTNIARDAVADAEVGRVYLPGDWLADAGLDPDTLADPRRRDALTVIVARLLDVADTYYASAARGIRYLPFRSAWAVASARNVYRDIGSVVRRRGTAAWDKRARVGTAGKLVGVSRGLGRAVLSGIAGPLPPASRQGLWTHPGLERGSRGDHASG